MESEANDKYNKNVKPIVDKLYKLRSIEHSSKSMKSKYKSAKKIIDTVTDELTNKKDYIIYRPMWEDLHDRMVYYYDYLNKSNVDKRIPVFRMTLHNNAIIWWLECMKRNKLSGPIVHFDTHDDMGIPLTSKGLLKQNGSVDYNGMKKGACAKIFWPVTCLLLAKGTDHVIWAMPKWVYDDNNGFDQVLVTTKSDEETVYLRDRSSKKDNFMLQGDIVLVDKEELVDKKEYKFYHPMRLDRLHVDSSRGWNILINTIQTKFFILDIDLDFFVSNGEEASVSVYKKDFNDLQSDGRVHGFPGLTTPREAYSDEISREMVKLLNKEVVLIKKRIVIFLNGLKKLKQIGIKPSCVTISDSCTTLFSGNSERAVFTNQYTPKYFVPLIKLILMKGLNNLYTGIL